MIAQLEDPTQDLGAALFEALEPSSELSREMEERLASLLGEARAAEAPLFVQSVFDVIHRRSVEESRDVLREGLRRRIASALSLSPNHPLVKQWSEAHRRMQRDAHARPQAPPAGPMRAAFDELARLLYGRVGPIFATQADLDRLAAIPNPDARDIAVVRQLVPRAVQRRYFFRQLHGPGWVRPLRIAGFFEHPPEREVFADGSWRMQPWPEGDYLLRMAPHEPDEVCSALSAVPQRVENPIVWDVVADAISILPTAQATRLVPLLTSALQRPLASHTSSRAITAAGRLAREGSREAFRIAEILLWCPGPAMLPEREANEPTASFIARLREFGRPLIRNDAWALHRIERHDLRGVFDTLIGRLEELDAHETFELVLERLVRAVRCVRRARCRIRDRMLEAMEEERATPGAARLGEEDSEFAAAGTLARFQDVLGSTDDEAGDSHYWCDDLDSRDPDDDGVRAQLARTLLGLARRQIAAGSPAAEVIAALDRAPEEICRRIQWRIMAGLAQLDADVHTRLDELLVSDEALSPPYRAREVAALLRAHFAGASESAQLAFVRNLERGPRDEFVSNIIEFRGDADDSASRADVVADWQRRRIRWFHDRIPSALVPLSERLGVPAMVPALEQRSLDEVGYWSSGAFSAGARSPRAPEELAELSPSELAQYLGTWRPDESTGDPFDRSTTEGLRDAVRALVEGAPERVAPLLEVLGSRPVSLRYVSAIVNGLQSAIRQGKRVRFEDVLALARYAWHEATKTIGDADGDPRQPVWTALEVCTLIETQLDTGERTPESANAMWVFAASAFASDLTWRAPGEEHTLSTITEVWRLTRSDLAGRVVSLLVAIAWRDFLDHHSEAQWPPIGESQAGARLVPLLEAALTYQGTAGIAVQAAVGERVHQLLWMARDWTTAKLERLFDGGAEDLLRHPSWSMYLWTSRLIVPAFHVLRPWYVRAAKALPANGVALPVDPDWVLGDALVKDLLLAISHGVCSTAEEQELLTLTFSRVPVKSRNHGYWIIYRGWSVADADDVRGQSPRVIDFWEWRLGELERQSDSADREEEADGLSWFLATPHLAPEDTIRLGRRTVALLGAEHHTTSQAWTRLAGLAAVDAQGTFEIVERIVELALENEYPYLPFDEVAPCLRPAIRANELLRHRVRTLVNRLGEVGFDEYRSLWNEGAL